jgi:enoyl-[acyl-carrier protein] reductase I
MSFLDVSGKAFVVFGLSNRKSVAWAVGQALEREGAVVHYGVRTAERLGQLEKLLAGRPAFVCDVEEGASIEAAAAEIRERAGTVAGIVFSVAFANYSEGLKPFHETKRADFLQATQISAFALVEIARAFKDVLAEQASVVAIGISSYVTASSYGYMSPIKSCLEGCVRFLAKSFSRERAGEVRFNAVNAGPLKTKSSAGIPGYLENYLFAEKLTMRRRALETEEVANTVAFLLSPRSSGINAQGIVVNAGIDWNYFDEDVVRLTMRPDNS